MKIVIFFISFLFFGKSYSQNSPQIIFDSQKEYTQKFVDSILINDIIIRSSHYRKILESNDSLLGWPRYFQGMASIVNRERKMDSTIYYANKAIDTFNNGLVKRPLDEKFLVPAYHLKGYSYSILKDYDASIINFQKALDLSKKYPYKWISFTYAGLARIHSQINNDSLAIQYFLKASKDSSYIKLPRPMISTFTHIASIYDDLGNYENASIYYNQALKRSFESDYKDNISAIYSNLGISCFKRNMNDSTFYYFKKAYKTDIKFGLPAYKGADDNNALLRGFINNYQGKTNEAVKILSSLTEKIINYETPNESDKEVMMIALQVLGKAYEKQGNYKEYNRLLNLSNNFSDKLYQVRLKEDLQNLETQYQTKEKDASIAQLEKNRQQQEKIINQQRIIAFGLGGLLILLSGLGYLFWRQRKLKNQYEKENLEQRLLRSQMNPHFVSNALNTICALVEKKSDNTIPYVNKLASLFRLTLQNSREEFISLNEELAALKNYLELQSNLSHDFDFRIKVDETIDKDDIIIPPMLIQPFVENAIVHGISRSENRGTIKINIVKDHGGLLLCEINDNGKGYTKQINITGDKPFKSVSGDIVKERLAILKKKFKVNTRLNINSNPKSGTQVELYLPYLVD